MVPSHSAGQVLTARCDRPGWSHMEQPAFNVLCNDILKPHSDETTPTLSQHMLPDLSCTTQVATHAMRYAVQVLKSYASAAVAALPWSDNPSHMLQTKAHAHPGAGWWTCLHRYGQACRIVQTYRAAVGSFQCKNQ